MSDLFPRMVYRVGGQEEMHGAKFDYELAQDQDALDTLLADGWYLTTCEATAAAAPSDEPMLTRDEIEAEATLLGLKFDGRTKDAKLMAMIDVELAKRGAP